MQDVLFLKKKIILQNIFDKNKAISSSILDKIEEKCETMPEDKNDVPFYVKHWFTMMENGATIQICTYSNAQ